MALVIRSLLSHICRWLCILIISTVQFCGLLQAQQLPVGFAISQLQTGYDQPTGSALSADGLQLYVWEKRGLIWVSKWNGTTYIRQPSPVLDIQDEVGNWRDFGLLSVCLDPNFQTNGLLYLLYTVDRHHLLYYGTPSYSPTLNEFNNATISRVTRYQISNTGGVVTAIKESRKILIGETKRTGILLTHESHGVGTLLFGRDGTLLVSTGDNASYNGPDRGDAADSYYQTALREEIMRPEENVGAFRAQMLNSLCGKVLRIDPNTGNGLPSNPFYNGLDARSARSRVWALGLRNPFRMTLQPNTGSVNSSDGNPGTILLGDVGWNTWDEAHVIDQAGLNCGWPIYEGLTPTPEYDESDTRNRDEPGQPTFVSLCRQPTGPLNEPNPANRRFIHARPVLDWHHTQPNARVPAFEGNTAVTRTIGTAGAPAGTPFTGSASVAGVYYTGTQFPAIYRNTYFFADFGQNWIRNTVFDQNQVNEVREFVPAWTGQGIVDLKMNPRDGSLLYINIYSGQVMRIAYRVNQPPVAAISVDKRFGASPLTVQFTGANSVDPEGTTLSYTWDFGDGTTSTEATPTHTYLSSSTTGFSARLTVRDNGNLTDTKTVLISVNNEGPPSVKISSPGDGTLYPLDRESAFGLQAIATDKNVTKSTPQFVEKYEWRVTLRHNAHEHREPAINEVSPTVLIAPAGCTSSDTYYYLITCQVTDNGGLTATDSIKLYPDCSSSTIAIRDLIATPQPNAVQLSWENPVVPFQEVLVVAQANQGLSDRPSGTSYTADANFNGAGTPVEDGKVVYRGTNTGVTVTNLTASTPYFFRVYTRANNIWNGGVETQAIPLAATNSPSTGPVFTLKAGRWDDPTVWSGNRIPTQTNAAQLNHSIIIPANYSAQALTVELTSGGQLQLETNATLHLNP
jgi:glucose/arabinose dehydrogenase